MLAAASSFFGRTNISQSYTIGSGSILSRTSTPTPSSSGVSLPAAAHSPPFNVGPWRVQSATHKVTGKRVSVWSADKRGPEMERMGPASKERYLEVLKTEAQSLSKLRHPSILEMVEPLEETRNELIFATEPVLSSLHLSIPGSIQYSPLVELDEVEIQKGILQLCKGLVFLHTSARLIHTNINPESIIINSAGDWKISGLGLTIPLSRPDGQPSRWEFPTFDGRVPAYTQRSFDYIAPEYALDEVLDPASDMYSLGCLMYAVHCKGSPPFKNHGSLGAVRDNAGKPLAGVDRLDSDLRELLRSLITRQPHNRPSPTTLPHHAFFSSLPISTLNFLDRSTFAAKSREEKISFMKGLTSVLDRFSEGLRTRKILPSLLEEMKDTHLLPYILPNVFAISQILSPSQFASLVLPSLKPLFAIREPPQNMITLLDNLQMLQAKTEKAVFREHVLPLVYNAMDSEHAIVQERALKVVPDLCDTIDYAEVQNVLFPRVALVFTKTRVLTVKVATLVTFLSMVKTLDQTSLTQKLVPLLAKIRTKEPAVMMATLAVHEAMGMKVDREAVATLVLPQLWAMSMGPLLSVSQFKRFMEVIKKLGDRVEKEHDQYLRDSQRIEDRSATPINGITNQSAVGGVDFENLVGSGAAQTVRADTVIDPAKGWDDDVWGSIFNSAEPSSVTSPPLSPPAQSQVHSQPVSSSPQISPASRPTPASRSSRGLGATPVPFNTSAFTQTQTRPSLGSARSSLSTSSSLAPQIPAQPPQHSQGFAAPASGPNYNISLPAAPIMPSAPMVPSAPLQPMQPMLPAVSSPPLFAAPSVGSLMTPSRPPQPAWPGGNAGSKQLSKDDWGDFDPLA
ncbi:other/SCY1 protein kinase [Phanerochaete sordida]|uniref:Other/SCY1 protein kinase n=1 Tax=Phanerochaete sordida TaxID=48140 RepID=A0A9P3G2A7_9APHY|nr:other/SCY1 protein kinase [Phanerochaete sordida]